MMWGVPVPCKQLGGRDGEGTFTVRAHFKGNLELLGETLLICVPGSSGLEERGVTLGHC